MCFDTKVSKFSVYINAKGKLDDEMNFLLITNKEKNHYFNLKVVDKLFQENRKKQRLWKLFCTYYLVCSSNE